MVFSIWTLTLLKNPFFDENPFCDLDPLVLSQDIPDPELVNLLQKTCGIEGSHDDTCVDMDDLNWQEKFVQELYTHVGPSSSKQPCDEVDYGVQADSAGD